MKIWLLLLFACLSVNVLAQQTYFDVPSSDLTPQGKILLQEQVDFSPDAFRTATTFSYGLGHDWEVGFNLYNLDYLRESREFFRNDTTAEKPFAPLLLLNAQKGIALGENFQWGFGVQGGLNLAPTVRSRWVGYAYTNLEGQTTAKHYKATIGLYTGNVRYLGEGPSVGFQTGFDAGLVYEKFHLLGDWVSGSHALGRLTLGAEVYLGKHLPLALGWRRSNQDGSQTVVLQLTYTPE